MVFFTEPCFPQIEVRFLSVQENSFAAFFPEYLEKVFFGIDQISFVCSCEETEIGRGKSNQGNSVYAGGNIFRGITLLEKYNYANIISSQEIIHVPVVHTELP